MRIVVGRIPGYAKHSKKLSARAYVEKVMNKSIFDPVLTIQLANGFVLKRLIADYLSSDTESQGYATLLEWTNIDYQPIAHKRYMTSRPVRVCAVQYRMRSIDGFSDFAQQCEYFIEFPEATRIAVDKGAEIIFVPFCTDERHAYLRVRCCAQARCIENSVFVVIAGTVGNLPFAENMDIQYAQSGIFTPTDFPFSRDAVAAECRPNIETVVIHDLDLELLRRHRMSGATQNLRDRRNDLYEIVLKK